MTGPICSPSEIPLQLKPEDIPTQKCKWQEGKDTCDVCVHIKKSVKCVFYKRSPQKPKAEVLSLFCHWFAYMLDEPAEGAHSRHFAGIPLKSQGPPLRPETCRGQEAPARPWWWLSPASTSLRGDSLDGNGSQSTRGKQGHLPRYRESSASSSLCAKQLSHRDNWEN